MLTNENKYAYFHDERQCQKYKKKKNEKWSANFNFDKSLLNHSNIEQVFD